MRGPASRGFIVDPGSWPERQRSLAMSGAIRDGCGGTLPARCYDFIVCGSGSSGSVVKRRSHAPSARRGPVGRDPDVRESQWPDDGRAGGSGVARHGRPRWKAAVGLPVVCRPRPRPTKPDTFPAWGKISKTMPASAACGRQGKCRCHTRIQPKRRSTGRALLA